MCEYEGNCLGDCDGCALAKDINDPVDIEKLIEDGQQAGVKRDDIV